MGEHPLFSFALICICVIFQACLYSVIMNNKLLLCLSLVLSSGIAHKATAQPYNAMEPYENQTVGRNDVKIENLPENSSFDKQTVLAKLRTRQGDRFSQFVFDQDLKQLAEDYDRVEPQLKVSDGQVDITLKIWLRPLIRTIKWEGNQYFKTKKLQKELDIKPGTIFNRTEFNKSFNKVKEYYIKKGYFEAELSYQLVPDRKTQEVDIVIQVSEGRSGKVENIVLSGLSKDQESDILHKLYTKKYSSLTSWFTGMGNFQQEALEQDRLTIFNYMQDQGYADARVNIQILESSVKGKIILDIHVDKGALYHFGQVSFDGNILFNDDEVEKIFYARPDGVYSPEKLRNTAEAIKDLYGRKGYIDTSVTYETQLDRDAPIYNVHFHVEEGREYRIGMIRVIGNVQTETRVILRESLLVPGENFDSLKLKITQARLENMGYFKAVNVYAVRTQDDLSLGDNYRDIYIEVEETQTGNVSLFSGFSSADNIFGGLDLTERNFNYKGIGNVFQGGLGAVRGGGEFLHMRASFGPAQQSYMVSWLTPYFLDSMWRIGFEASATLNSQLQSKDYDIDTYNLGLFVSYPLTPYWTYGVKYRIRNVDISLNIHDRERAKAESNNGGILSGIGTSFTYDSTDHPVKPHRGLRSFIDGEFVGAGGDSFFIRTAYLNSYYTPLTRRSYMRYRWDFRFIFPIAPTNAAYKIPISERFFLGGVSSVRGYKDFILGPRYEKQKGTHPDGSERWVTEWNDPKGGISSSLLSLEYTYEVIPMADLFLFMDAGYVTNDTFGFGTYRMSYGVGVNLDILGRMPLTLGFGFPINAARRQKAKNHFFFSMGGQF